VVSAAKREGRLVFFGPAGTDNRDGLALGFQKKYPEIQVDYTGGFGAQLVPKITGEQAAGQFQVDVIVSGANTILRGLTSAALEPIRPFLVGPNVEDGPTWTDGKLRFMDSAGMYNISFSGQVQSPGAYNPKIFSASELKSYKDLLNPKWKGKLAVGNPRVPGAANAVVHHWYITASANRFFTGKFFEDAAGSIQDINYFYVQTQIEF
jgi:iron(III) transport system substrate-binding protein